MQNISQNDLLSLWLKYESKSQIISQKALDNLILKALFLQEPSEYVSLKDLKKSLDAILHGDLNQDRLMEAINGALSSELEVSKGEYRLKTATREKIQRQSFSSQQLHNEIINRYFKGATSSKDSIITWFKWVLSEFFIRYYGEWMGNRQFSTIDQNEHIGSIDSIITESFQRPEFQLDETDHAYLRKHFDIFFKEQSEKGSAKIFTAYGISCFSALLVYSSLFANKATIEAFKDATFLLDTNILLTINIEDDKQNKLCRLEQALKGLNVSIAYLNETASEYYRYIHSVYEQLQDNAYELETLPRTVVIDAAIGLGCCDPASVENFYNTQLKDLPSVFSEEIPIEKYKDTANDIDIICREPQKRTDVADKLDPILVERRRRKTENAKQHDISLLVAATYLLSKGKKLYVLTYDKCIQRYTQQYPYQDTNYSLGLDALMALLAIDGAGLDVNDTSFSSLFKQIIKIETIPYDDTDEILLDIYRVNTILNKITELQPSISENLQQEVLNMRISNVSAQEIALKMERKLDQVRKDKDDEVENYRSQLSTLENEVNELRKTNDTQFEYIVDGLQTKRVVGSCVLWLLILAAVIGLGFLVYGIYADEYDTWNNLAKIADGFSIFGFGGFLTLIKRKSILTFEWCKREYIKRELHRK